jgi:hypothetical protein
MWRTYAQLVRLPNVFTAMADIALGAVVTGALPSRLLPFGLLLLASSCLYSAGMVWNDWFDLEQDRRERPFRPLPSGRVSPTTAALFGTLLMALGVGFAAIAGRVQPETSGWLTPSAGIAVALVVAILLYDGWLKRTWAGPLGMGVCRALNVLLGLSVAGGVPWPWGWHLALVVGLYIVGVTWFARTEARESSRQMLAAAAVLMLVSIALGLPLAAQAGGESASPLFPYLLVGLAFLVGFPAWRAVHDPRPSRVQPAVRRAIFGLVLLDATLATALAGTPGLLIALLILPALFLGRWLYST